MSPAESPEAQRRTVGDWTRSPDDGRLHELLEGELVAIPLPNIEHQRVSRELGYSINSYLRRTGQGEVFHAPVGVRLSEDTVVEPDLVVVLQQHAGRIQERYIAGPPDIVIEILSPGNARRDLHLKRALYQRFGVPEHWIVDPAARMIEILTLGNGELSRAAFLGDGDVLASQVLPELSIELGAVFRFGAGMS